MLKLNCQGWKNLNLPKLSIVNLQGCVELKGSSKDGNLAPDPGKPRGLW